MNAELMEVLHEALQFAEAREDVIDSDDGPRNNDAMQLAQRLRATIDHEGMTMRGPQEIIQELTANSRKLVAELIEAREQLALRDGLGRDLRDTLQRVLDTHEQEAKCYLSAQVAEDNFSAPRYEQDAYAKACGEASAAEKAARALLAATTGQAHSVSGKPQQDKQAAAFRVADVVRLKGGSEVAVIKHLTPCGTSAHLSESLGGSYAWNTADLEHLPCDPT